MRRDEFIQLAGGVYESPVHYDQWSERDKYESFWSFYEEFYQEARSLYAGVEVAGLIQRGEYSIEHIIPKGMLRRHLQRVDREVRFGATVNPFNLAPCHRDLNNFRQDLPFDFDGDHIREAFCIELPQARVCVVGVDHEQQWVVPLWTRGDVARAILYMSLVYNLERVFCRDIDTLLQWAQDDPPDVWEVRYNEWVRQRLGIWNPLISDKPHKLPRQLLQDTELMRSFRCK
jgi:hypothetical protein